MPWQAPETTPEEREGCWYYLVKESHDLFCACGGFVSHLNSLAARMERAVTGTDQPPPAAPGGPRGQIRRPLPAACHTETWPSGGDAGAGDRGSAAGGGAGAEGRTAADGGWEGVDFAALLEDALEGDEG